VPLTVPASPFAPTLRAVAPSAPAARPSTPPPIVAIVAAALAIGAFNTAFEFGSTASLGKVCVLVLIIAFLQWRPRGLVALRAR
jgi:hypothetical protein